MNDGAFRGVVRGGVVVALGEGIPLAEGAEVLVSPIAGAPGSSAAVLAAMEASPQVPADWVDELEQLIAEGRRLPSLTNPFADEAGNREGS